MSEHLLDNGYQHAAASLAGAVHEDGLCRAAVSRGCKATGNSDSLNDVSVEKGLDDWILYTWVKIWIDSRNAADHGDFDKVAQTGATSQLSGFLAWLQA